MVASNIHTNNDMVHTSTMPQKRQLLSENIAEHTKMGDKRKLIHTLQTTPFLNCIKLDHISSLKIKVAERKAMAEGAVINGVQTVPQSHYYGTIRLLQDLTVQLCQLHDLPLNPTAVYESIIARTFRAVAAGDAYIKLKRIIRSSNVSLVRLDHLENNALTTTSITSSRKGKRGKPGNGFTSKKPCTIELFVCQRGQLHANISTTTTFGLIRNSDLLYGKGYVNQHGFLVNQQKKSSSNNSLHSSGENESIEAWITFQCVVIEKMNISTGDYLRFAKVVI